MKSTSLAPVWLLNGRILSSASQSVLDGDVCYKLGSADYKILEILIANLDKPVSRDTLFEQAWEGKIVSDARLTQSIFNIRYALGDDGKAQKILKTIAKKGYMLSGEHVAFDNEFKLENSNATQAKGRLLGAIQIISLISLFIGSFILGAIENPGKEYLDNIPEVSFLPYNGLFSNGDNIRIYINQDIEPTSLNNISTFNPPAIYDYYLDIYILKNNFKFTYVLYSPNKQMSINFEKNLSLIEGLEESLRIFNENQP